MAPKNIRIIMEIFHHLLKRVPIYSFYFLIGGLALIAAFSVSLVVGVTGKGAAILVAGLWLCLSALWVLIWLYLNRVPVNRPDKVGVLVVLSCKDSKFYDQVSEDFVEALKGDLSRNSSNVIVLRVLNPLLSEKYSDFEDAKSLQRKKKFHLLIHGAAKKRGSNAFLDLQGNVLHAPIPLEVRDSFRQDISEKWMPRFAFEDYEGTVELFETGSQFVSISARYVLGKAAFLSRDLFFAEKMFGSCLESCQGREHFPQVRGIKKGCNESLNTIYINFMGYYYGRWLVDGDCAHIAEAKRWSDEVFWVYKKRENYLMLAAIVEALTGDMPAAQVALDKVKVNKRGAVWEVNQAFVHMHLDKFSLAIGVYLKETSLADDLIFQIENFITLYDENIKPSARNYLLLGLLNELMKGDEVRAREDYQTCIDRYDEKVDGALLELAAKKIPMFSSLLT